MKLLTIIFFIELIILIGLSIVVIIGLTYFALTYEDIEEDTEKVEQRHGHWIMEKDGDISYLVCSECGKIYGIGFNYCPNCGAKMDEKGE